MTNNIGSFEEECGKLSKDIQQTMADAAAETLEMLRPPVIMHHLICIGGCAHGEVVDIPSNQDFVNVAERRRFKIRPVNEVQKPLNPDDAMFRYDEYRRTWVQQNGGPRIQVLVVRNCYARELDYLLHELQAKGKI